MSKIVVEDLTDNSKAIEIASSLLIIYASSLGIESNLSQKDVATALFTAGESFLKFGLSLNSLHDGDEEEIKDKALQYAEAKFKLVKESGTIDNIKKLMEKDK